jgi:hypothetical protein
MIHTEHRAAIARIVANIDCQIADSGELLLAFASPSAQRDAILNWVARLANARKRFDGMLGTAGKS